jgi:hypothetical protein
VEVYYAWRPNLPDEAGNHLIELGVAAQAEAIVTGNLRDLARGELKFPALKILTPSNVWRFFHVHLDDPVARREAPAPEGPRQVECDER